MYAVLPTFVLNEQCVCLSIEGKHVREAFKLAMTEAQIL